MEETNSKNYELAQIIVRQTNLTEEEAKTLLEENNYDLIKSIKHFYGLTNKKEAPQEKVSVNQQIYKEIRTLMDSASKSYREKQEQEKN